MTDIGTGQAARALQVTAPTVRAWARDGLIAGRQVKQGARLVWRMDADSVERHARARAEAASSQLTLGSLAARVADLEQRAAEQRSEAATGRAHTDAPAGGAGHAAAAGGPVSAADLLHARAVMAEQAAADAARADVIKHLLAALAASEDADAHRRSAIDAAQTALGLRLIPDDPSGVSDTAQR